MYLFIPGIKDFYYLRNVLVQIRRGQKKLVK